MSQSKRTHKNLSDAFASYKKTAEKPLQDVKVYLDIVYGYLKLLMIKIIEGEDVRLPSRTGALKIRGNRQKISFEGDQVKGLSPDWQKTKELWSTCEECREKKQMVYHLNEHTGGIRYKLLWSKHGMLVENKNLYSFQLARTNKRMISSAVKGGKEYYSN
jgi:hypothetical protein